MLQDETLLSTVALSVYGGCVPIPSVAADLPQWLTDRPTGSPRQALELARARIVAGQRLDMSALADELGRQPHDPVPLGR